MPHIDSSINLGCYNLKSLTMTRDDLYCKHHAIRFTTDHCNVSIQYAIEILEGMQKWWEMGSENRERLDKKIDELKKQLK